MGGALLAGERILPPRLFVAAIAFMVGLHFVEPGPILWGAPWIWLGGVPALVGLVVELRAHALFERAGTPINPFAAPRVLVTEGPFALSRNPLYLGMVLALAGLAILLGSTTPFILVVLFAVIVDRRYIVHEEAALEAAFGDAWRAYGARVRRWI